jgi:hypothetical protein
MCDPTARVDTDIHDHSGGGKESKRGMRKADESSKFPSVTLMLQLTLTLAD